MSSPRLRTRLLALLTGAAIVGTAPVIGPTAAHATPDRTANITAGFQFLNRLMDTYGTGTTIRVPQSFDGGQLAGFVSSFVYDDSLMVNAYLARNGADDRARAQVLGDSLIYAQQHDTIGDGRVRNSYQPDPFITANGTPYVGGGGAFTGNEAWVGMALVHLSDYTGQTRFLDAALRIGNWIQNTTYDTRGVPGYMGGRDDTNTAYTFKATEHNIDVAAFFHLLYRATLAPVWQTRSDVAWNFVQSMWDATGNHYWTGTNPDGVTTNYYPVPEDVQTWAYMARPASAHASAIDYTTGQLSATDGTFTGVSFSNVDRSKVWFEGTAHVALALLERGNTGDAAQAGAYLDSIQLAQASAPNNDGHGIVAASHDGLDTGFGDTYYASLHTGATAWYLLAALDTNPFQF